MFDLNAFIMKTLKGMIGNYPDFQVREYALNWYAKGTLAEDDLATIEALIEAQYIVPEPAPSEDVEEVAEETETDLTETETETEETVTEEPQATA